MWRWDHSLRVSSDRLKELAIKLGTSRYKACDLSATPWMLLPSDLIYLTRDVSYDVSRGLMFTSDRRQSKALEAEYSIAIGRQNGDKW